MKNIFFAVTIILCLIVLGTDSYAQSILPIRVGVKTGGNYSNLGSTDYLKSSYENGYFAGAIARLDIGKIYFQTELLYSEKRAKLKEKTSSTEQKTIWRSVDLPIVVGIKVLEQDGFNIRVFGGGLYSYVLKDNMASLLGVTQLNDRFNKSNFGYRIGAGVDINKFSLDLAYDGGLSKMSEDFGAKSRSVSMSIGYFLF